MHCSAADDAKPAPRLDLVMDAAIGAAVATFVLSASLPLTLGALCVVWLAGMALADPLRA